MSRLLFTALGVAALLCGCAQSATGPVSAEGQWSDAVAHAIEAARNDGAASDQLNVLAEVSAAGSIEWHHVEDALGLTFACFDSAGVEWESESYVRADGVRKPGYTYWAGPALTDAEGIQLGQECVARNSFYVELLWAQRPENLEAGADFHRAVADNVRSCLDDLGLGLGAGATDDEVMAVAFELLGGASGSDSSDGVTVVYGEPGQGGSGQDPHGGPDCIGPAIEAASVP